MPRALPIPRPGARFGPYPERTDKRAPWPWYAAERLRAALLAPRTPPAAERARFLRAVRARRTLLEGCNVEFIAANARRLRSQLALEGMRDALVEEVFALIDACMRHHLQLRLHDAQLLAGLLMLERRLVEMQTGEGKTLAVALAAAAGGLAGIPVHVVTANDYLVERDQALLAPVFATLGLSSGTVTSATPLAERAHIYRCDITYCTARELAFDYLRDRLAASAAGRSLRGLCMAIVDEADSVLIDEARMPLILSEQAANTEQAAFYRQALFLAAQLQSGEDYRLDPAQRRALLTPAGKARAQDLAAHIGGPWQARRRREEMLCLALAAQHLFLKERHYLVRERQVVIIDDTTGRAAPGRVWSQGLHQLIETKENCPLTEARKTAAQTTFQRFFSRYLRLSGISGTVREDHGQLLAIYGLPVAAIPLQFPSRRQVLGRRVFAAREQQWRYVVETASRLRAQGRPVLIGTDSIEESHALSEQLARAGVPHAVLNARFDAEEARIVAAAGQTGAVTVSTNMAGRGTDIRLGVGVAGRGGLHVIACQTNDTRRIDRQLFGRCARQGEPGSVEQLHCLGDAFRPLQGIAALAARLGRASPQTGELPAWIAPLARLAQRQRERYRRREQWFFYLREWQVDRQLTFTVRNE